MCQLLVIIMFSCGSLKYITVNLKGSGSVSVINPANNTVIKNITIGEKPGFIEAMAGRIGSK